MSAGRELDALVAEKVMGWTDVCSSSRKMVDGSTWYVPHGRPDAAFMKYAMVPAYSTDIAAAWAVVEKMGLSVVCSEDGWYAVKPEDIQHGTLRGTAYPTLVLVGREFAYNSASDAAPLAICRAALAAVGVEVPA